MSTKRIPKPSTEQDFEAMCAHIFGQKYNSSLPTMYGRRGQSQSGLDILLYKNDIYDKNHRIGIQCKHVEKLTFDNKSGDSVIKEVNKADSGTQDISVLVIATTQPSDRVLTDAVAKLNDQRVKNKNFAVQILFWNDIENIIHTNKALIEYYTNTYELIPSFLSDITNHVLKGNYRYALDMLNENKFFDDDYNIKLKYDKLLISAECFFYLDQKTDLETAIQALDKYEWENDNYTVLKIKNVNTIDKSKAREILKIELEKNPNSKKLILLDYNFKIIEDGIDLDINSINPLVKNTDEIYYFFLIKYSNQNNISAFDELYEKLNYAQKGLYKYKLIYAASRLNNLSINKNEFSKNQLIKSLEKLMPYQQKIWEIQEKNQKKLFIKIILNTYLASNQYQSILDLFNFIDSSKIEIENEILVDFLYAFKAINQQELFTRVAKDKYYNLEEVDRLAILEELFKTNNIDFVKSKINELKMQEQQYFNTIIWIFELKEEDFLQKIYDEDAINFESLGALIAISYHLFKILKNEILFENFNEKIKIHIDNNEKNTFVISNYYLETKQYELAIDYLKNEYEKYSLSETLIKIFKCYVKTKNFKKAQELFKNQIKKFDSLLELVNLSYEMAEETLDWSMCEYLIRELENTNQDQVWLWNMKLAIANDTKNKNEQKKLLRDIPENLEGSGEQICWLAAQEVKHNFIHKARQRIKQLWRKNIGVLEVESSILKLFFSFISRPKNSEHPFFSEQIKQVEPGVVIVLKSGDKIEEKFVDLDEYNSSPDGFINLESEFGKLFIDKTIGQTIAFTNPLGIDIDYQIFSIKPFLLKIWEDLSEKSNRIDNPFNFITPIQLDIETNEGMKKFIENFSKLHDKRAIFFKNGLDIYKSNPLSIHTFSNYLGISLVDVVYDWNNNFTDLLYSIDNQYTNEDKEYHFFLNTIKETKDVIVDLYSLIELQFFKKLYILDNFSNIFITKITFNNLINLINDHENILSAEPHGSLNFYNGKPILIEHDKSITEKRLSDLREILKFIEDKNFYIETGLGDGLTNKMDSVLSKLFTKAESSTIRLARESNLPICSFDARYRAIAQQYEINTFNLDDIVNHFTQDKSSLNIFFMEKFLNFRTLSDRYISKTSIIDFILLNDKNLNDLIFSYLRRIKKYELDQAISSYYNFIMKFIYNRIDITIKALDFINILFFNFLISENPSIDFEILKNKLINQFSTKIHTKFLFKFNKEDIYETNIKYLKLNKVTNPPSIYL